MKSKNAQIGAEYIIIIGLVTFVITVLLIIAFYYSNSSQDSMKISQLESFGNKVISSAESVYYYGFPARATIEVYLPEGVSSIEINENSLIATLQTSTGLNKRAFSSRVLISGSINSGYGLKRIRLDALESGVLNISSV